MSDLGLDKSDLLFALGATPTPGRLGESSCSRRRHSDFSGGALLAETGKIQIGVGWVGGWGGFHFFGF